MERTIDTSRLGFTSIKRDEFQRGLNDVLSREKKGSVIATQISSKLFGPNEGLRELTSLNWGRLSKAEYEAILALLAELSRAGDHPMNVARLQDLYFKFIPAIHGWHI